MAIRDDQFWASFLGIEPSDWNLPGISIRAHVGLIGYRGLWCFRHRDCVAVSAPAGWVSHLQSSLSDGEVNRVLEQAFLADLLGDEIERLIGPAYQGCLEPGAFRPSSTDNVRALEGEDGAALLQLDVTTHHVDDVDTIKEVLDEGLWNHAATEGMASLGT